MEEDEDIPLDTAEDLQEQGYIVNDTWEEAERTRNDAQSDFEEEMHEDELQIMFESCETYCYRLNLTANPRAISLSQGIAQRISERADLAARWGYFPGRTIAAVAVFTASHLTDMPKSMRWVAINCSDTPSEIADLYLYVHRDVCDAIDGEMLTMIGRGGRETVLGFIPVPE